MGFNVGGALGGVGGVISDAAKGVGGAVGDVWHGVTDALGMNPYKADQYTYNDKAFRADTGFQSNLWNQLNNAKNTQVPAAYIQQGAQDQFRNQQQTLAQALLAQSQGQGPSLAQSQLQQATDRNLQQALALQASQRCASAGQGLRNIGMQAANINQQAAQQSAALRMQEQMAAQQQLGGVLESGRGQDIGLAVNQAQLNQQAQIQQAQLQAQQAQAYMQMLQQQKEADRQAAIELERLRGNMVLGVQGINQQGKAAASQATTGMIGAAGQGAATYFGTQAKKQ